jgi:hypothetical protein
MKKWLIACLILGGMTSCSKWLDVTPQSDVAKEDLFKTTSGFQEAVNGLYTRLVEEDLYGRELTIATLDVLAQNYQIDINDNYRYLQTRNFNFQDENFVFRKDRIWGGLYNVIANANLILENIDKQKGIFDANLYQIIKGEALAIRGYAHFELLKLFADSYQQGAMAAGIPYATEFSKNSPPTYNVTQILDKCKEDLLAAKALLQTADPITQASYSSGYMTGTVNTEYEGAMFMQVRRQRMNYFAVVAVLARLHLYKGEQAQALNYAKEVIDSEKFHWTKQVDFLNPDDKKKDRILYHELIFSLYAPNRSRGLTDILGNQIGLTLSVNEANNIYETGGPGADDFRFKQWLQLQSGSNGTFMQFKKYTRDPDANLHEQLIPMIRLSELYYIAAECSFDTDPDQAWTYFNTVRLNRGIGNALNNPSKSFFLDELQKEYRKELLGEGQMYTFYKRLHIPIKGAAGGSIAPSKAIFVWPFPDDELAYGNR